MFFQKRLNVMLIVALISIPAVQTFADVPGCPPYFPRPGYCGPLNVTPSTSSESEKLKAELAQVGVDQFTSSDYKPGVVRHIVLFRYKPSVTPEQKEEVKRRFLALQEVSKRDGHDYIVSIETGSEMSGEGADQGLEQGFVVTFTSQGDRNYYLGQPIVTDPAFFDPHHQAFKNFVGTLLDKDGALVFDFQL